MKRTNTWKRKTTALAAALVATVGAVAQQINVEIKPLGLMSGAQTIYPTVVDSTLYFSSNQKWSLGKTYFDQRGDHMFRIFKVDLENGKPKGSPSLYFGKTERPYNMFSIAFAPDGTAYVSQNNINAKVVRGAPVSIYEYTSEGSDATGRALPWLSVKSNSSTTAVSPDGKMMIFASDMAGGEGRSDLYYCKREPGGWGDPINMGTTINTPGVEIAPYFHSSGKIFFSSNGRDDSQGLDLYYTFKTDTGFAAPVKFDEEINGTRDEYGLYYSDDEKWGFFTSNRKGHDEIYVFHRTFPTFAEKDSLEQVELCYTLFENSTENYDPSEYKFKWTFGDGQSAMGIEVDHCFPGPGTYDIELTVVDVATGEEMFSLVQYPLEIKKANQVGIVFPKVIKAGESVTFQADPEGLVDFKPLDFWWRLGNGEQQKGPMAITKYDKPGRYRVECGTIDARERDVKKCTWVEIEVK